MDVSHPTPAARIVARFGVETLSKWTGRHRTRVHAWTWPSDRGGTGGAIPLRVRLLIVEGARRDRSERLEFSDFEPQGDERYLSDEASAA